METRFTRLVGCDVPIQLAGMGMVSTPALAAAVELAEELGYAPAAEGDTVTLRNCPFHVLARAAPGVVCGLNQALLAGALDGLGARSVAADLVPHDGRCCVLLRQA